MRHLVRERRAAFHELRDGTQESSCHVFLEQQARGFGFQEVDDTALAGSRRHEQHGSDRRPRHRAYEARFTLLRRLEVNDGRGRAQALHGRERFASPDDVKAVMGVIGSTRGDIVETKKPEPPKDKPADKPKDKVEPKDKPLDKPVDKPKDKPTDKPVKDK